MSSVRDAYEQAIGFYNAGDIDGLANSYTEDALLVTPGATFEGRAAIRQEWGREEAAFPDRAVTTDLIVEQGDTLAAEMTWTGTHTGPLVLPDGTEMAATGKRVESRAMNLVQVRGGKVAMHHQYFDNMDFARQLGLVR